MRNMTIEILCHNTTMCILHLMILSCQSATSDVRCKKKNVLTIIDGLFMFLLSLSLVSDRKKVNCTLKVIEFMVE